MTATSSTSEMLESARSEDTAASTLAGEWQPDLAELNSRYKPLCVEDRIRELYKDFGAGEVLLTSSFAANSAFFLHLFSTVTQNRQKVHFIDTTYHFEETLEYKAFLTRRFGLDVVDLLPDPERNAFTQSDETWKKNPDFCCSINKVEPLMNMTGRFKVWASGLMGSQNEHRKDLRIFEVIQGVLRFYPIIDVTPEQRDGYILWHRIPFHPLVEEGYKSIGCRHCTVKGAGREGRWVGLAKTECGLHI